MGTCLTDHQGLVRSLRFTDLKIPDMESGLRIPRNQKVSLTDSRIASKGRLEAQGGSTIAGCCQGDKRRAYFYCILFDYANSCSCCNLVVSLLVQAAGPQTSTSGWARFKPVLEAPHTTSFYKTGSAASWGSKGCQTACLWRRCKYPMGLVGFVKANLWT